MYEKLNRVLIRYRELIVYGIFGLGATLINVIIYWILADIFHIHYILSNVLAWFSAFIFAFLTNKVFVFGSRNFKGKIAIQEMFNFFLARVFTGVLDMAIMWLLVDIGNITGVYAKVIVNVVVIVVNYLESKFWVFKKSKDL